MQVPGSVVLAAFVAALAVSGCSSSDGGPAAGPAAADVLSTRPTLDRSHTRVDISGRLEGVGGPAPGAPRGWRGSVSWAGPTHGTVRVDTDGLFTLSLPPGRYRLTGHSPRYGDGDYLCRAAHPLVVRAGRPLHLDVLCQMM
jgi:hypothetical protein